ncbi:MAG: hypothetical protein ACYC3I_19165 [Gemmataceae bacterium]
MPAPASKPPAHSSIELPEGIAEPEGQIGYFASAAGGIEALDLATGKVLWQTHEAQRPLLLDGDHLLAQAGTKRNRLRVLRLDCKNHGECDLESDPVVFPAWVVTGAADGHSFAARWHLEKHHLVLDWEASAWYAGKVHPTPEESLAAQKHAGGIARIDLRAGQIDILPAEQKQMPPPPPLPEQLERKSLRWQKLIGEHWKVVALEEVEKGQERLMLHTWDRQKQSEQPPKELLRGKRLLVRTTVDEQFLCLHEASPSPSPEEHGSLVRKKAPSWWWLFSVQTGKLAGRIPDEPGMNTIVVLGKRVFYLVPGALQGSLSQASLQSQTLRVINLSNGKKLWEHPVAGKLIAPPPL